MFSVVFLIKQTMRPSIKYMQSAFEEWAFLSVHVHYSVCRLCPEMRK
jgi:hypothetical protein